MKIKKIVAVLLLASLGLTACNGGGSSNNTPLQNNNTNGVTQPKKPGLKVNNMPENFVVADFPLGMEAGIFSQRVKIRLMIMETNFRKFFDTYQGGREMGFVAKIDSFAQIC